MLSLTIHVRTGSLEFPELGLRLERFARWSEIPPAFQSRMDPPYGREGDWTWRRVAPLNMRGQTIALVLGFRHELLELASFSLLPAAGAGRPSFDDAEEQARILRQAMEEQLGVSLTEGHGEFSWGEAYAYLSPKDGEASAGFDYGFFSR
jgi:hypothetical protein